MWSLSLAEGKAREAYTITEEDKKMDKQMVVVSDYVGDVGNRLNVRKRPGICLIIFVGFRVSFLFFFSLGMEDVSILDNDDDEEEEGMFSDSWWGAEKKKTKKAVVKSSVNDTIHVFSLASGHLYERFLKVFFFFFFFNACFVSKVYLSPFLFILLTTNQNQDHGPQCPQTYQQPR